MSHVDIQLRMGRADPAPPDANPPADVISAKALLAIIDERSREMDTKEAPAVERPIPAERRQPRYARPTWAAALGAAALGLMVAIAVLITRGGEDVAASNLGAIGALHNAATSGDYEGFQAAFADDATWRWVEAEGGTDDYTGSVSDAGGALPVVFAYADWDGDGTISDLDKITSNEMIQYANGRSELPPCTAQGPQVVCDQPAAGAFWEGETEVYSGTWTYTVEAGLITNVEWLITIGGSRGALARAGEFNAWLQENQPDLVDDLFVPLSPATSAWVTPDSIEAFRAAIDAWVADSR